MGHVRILYTYRYKLHVIYCEGINFPNKFTRTRNTAGWASRNYFDFTALYYTTPPTSPYFHPNLTTTCHVALNHPLPTKSNECSNIYIYYIKFSNGTPITYSEKTYHPSRNRPTNLSPELYSKGRRVSTLTS